MDTYSFGTSESVTDSSNIKAKMSFTTTRKRSLCFDTVVSPSLELADNLQDLTTSSKRKSKDINRVRRKLSLPPNEAQHLILPSKKLSIDDGCIIDSPAPSSINSSPVSNSSRFGVLASRKNVLFSRFKSEPEIQTGRRNSDENKENEAVLLSAGTKANINGSPSLESCFKSPHVTQKLKKVAFRNQIIENSSPPMRTSCVSVRQRRSLVRQESVDDGFVEQFTCLEETPRKLNLPKNFERLLFSPLVECLEHDLTPSNSSHYNHSSSSTLDKPLLFTLPESYSMFPSHSLFSDSYGWKSCKVFESSAVEMNAQENRGGSVTGTMTLTKKKVSRSESVDEQQLCLAPIHSKKRRRDREMHSTSFPTLTKCHSEAELCIKSALNLDEMHQDLIGDFSRKYSLPLIRGKHQDLKTISIDTMASLLQDVYSDVVDSFIIVDCRYPYEFQGGHIKGAINVHSALDIVSEFFSEVHSCLAPSPVSGSGGCSGERLNKNARTIIIFHCEFSSERGPKLSRFLRNTDREKNADSYPSLLYPELYLLEGGYKAFFEVHPELCEPSGYVPMLDPKYSSDLRLFRNRSCSFLTSKSHSRFLFSDR